MWLRRLRSAAPGKRENGVKPTFLLGVGAQKAGTSFLFDALRRSPGIRLPHRKEMHVFDSHFIPELCRDHVEIRRRLCEEVDRTTPGRGREARDLARRMRHALMLYDLDEYVSYFRELAEKTGCTGEITPGYSMLETRHLHEIRELLEPHFELRVIFLMRDPIDRIYSALRMHDKIAGVKKAPAHERFRAEYHSEGQRRRSMYEKILPRLEKVFGKELVFVEFYENLFLHDTFQRLEGFLGIAIPGPDMGKKVNASPKREELLPEAVSEARAYYAATYDFCRSRFPEYDLEGLWPYMRVS